MSNNIDEELSRLEEELKKLDPELAKELDALTEEAEAEDSAVPAEEDLEEPVSDTDQADAEPMEFPDPVKEEKKKKKKNLRGLIIYNVLVLAGIICVMIFWFIRYNALFL